MSKEGGRIIEDTRLLTREAIRKHQENAPWEYREEARFWYAIGDDLDKTFYNGFIYPDGKKVPPPILAWEDLGNKNTIAKYDLYEDGLGLVGKITFNTAHYIDWVEDDGRIVKRYVRGRYAQLETYDHEWIHLTQQIGRGKDPYNQKKHGRVTHNKEWHTIARSHGLNPEGPQGIHTRPMRKGSPLDLFAEMHGIVRPPEADMIAYDGKTNWAAIMLYAEKPKPKGRSTLTKYECPHCGLKVRIGIKDDPRLVHDSCSNVKGEKVFLVKHDGLEHTIFESAGDDEKPKKDPPTIIDEINENIRKSPLGDLEEFTFEGIATKVGINEKVLSEWLESDSEFTTALERLKDVQENDPFKTGTDEDTFVNSMMIAVVLLETKDRHYKSENQ